MACRRSAIAILKLNALLNFRRSGDLRPASKIEMLPTKAIMSISKSEKKFNAVSTYISTEHTICQDRISLRYLLKLSTSS